MRLLMMEGASGRWWWISFLLESKLVSINKWSFYHILLLLGWKLKMEGMLCLCGSLFTKHTPKCHLCAISAVKGSELHSLRKAVLATLTVLLAPRRSSCLVWKAAVKLCLWVCVCFAGEGGRVILCFSIRVWEKDRYFISSKRSLIYTLKLS